MKIIIFGNNSNIARDLIFNFLKKNVSINLIGRKLNQNFKKCFFQNLDDDLLVNKNFDMADLAIFCIYDKSNDVEKNNKLLKKSLLISNNYNVKNFIFISSTHIYKINNKLVEYDINSEIIISNIYVKNKIESENIVKDFCKKMKMNFTILRTPHVLTYNNSKLIKTIIFTAKYFSLILPNNYFDIKNTYITSKYLFFVINKTLDETIKKNETFLISENLFLSLKDIFLEYSLLKSKKLYFYNFPKILLFFINIFIKFFFNNNYYLNKRIFRTNFPINFNKNQYTSRGEFKKILKKYV